MKQGDKKVLWVKLGSRCLRDTRPLATVLWPLNGGLRQRSRLFVIYMWRALKARHRLRGQGHRKAWQARRAGSGSSSQQRESPSQGLEEWLQVEVAP